MQPFLALITPVGDAGGSPPVQPPSGAHPAHPIYYPDAHPEHPIYYPPGIWPDPGVPTHPIAPGGPPPRPTHPIFYPPGTGPHPEHPIYYPPGTEPHPEHPIVLPPAPPENADKPLEAKILWTPETGWKVIYVPTGDHVTPSS